MDDKTLLNNISDYLNRRIEEVTSLIKTSEDEEAIALFTVSLATMTAIRDTFFPESGYVPIVTETPPPS